MKLYLGSKIKYMLQQMEDTLRKVKEKIVVVLPWSFPDYLKENEVETQWIIPGMKKYYQVLKDMGYNITVENCYTKSHNDIERDLEKSSVIIITGGNPNKLFDTLLPFKHKLKNYNGIIIGESAGAEIFFDNYYITEPNSILGTLELKQGLGLINSFYMDVHSQDSKEYINNLINIGVKDNRDMYYVDNESMLLYNTKTRKISRFGHAKRVYKRK